MRPVIEDFLALNGNFVRPAQDILQGIFVLFRDSVQSRSQSPRHPYPAGTSCMARYYVPNIYLVEVLVGLLEVFFLLELLHLLEVLVLLEALVVLKMLV